MTQFPIERLLSALKFEKNMINGVWRRSFADVELRVDCANEKFLYEEAGITVTTATTSNFSQDENFVVFECICRLLEKGYKPKDLELEPAWRFGHNDKAARADIWVRTTNKSGRHSLLIIECKTPGREFDSAWRGTCEDGGQLFSYFHQERATKFLCLYTSELLDGKKVRPDYYLINVQDNEEYLKTLTKPKTYAKADNAKGLFAVWRDTYRLDAAKVGLFESDIAAYKPGKNKYSLADLSEINHAAMQRKYNEFATILRQHSVSGRENAFDKLVNLFLAKVVDESRNGDELMFYWKGIAYDSPFELQDRLESLYSIGMKEFLGETVTYIQESDIKKAFRRFEKDPDATKDAVLSYFRRLKFYTNNDFSFIDVHNERLFLENADILLKIVQMLEDIRLVTDEPNQFLGDLFEGFLDNGVKQSEGQFFTPLPVVRFIVSSLPLQEMIRSMPEPPRVIDYACGAGHFLNEYAQQIKPFIEAYRAGQDKDFFSVITGVEKEYRLSKVAKVAAFMYGEDEIKIVYADALVKSDDMPEESFDILVANPPYSVKGFLETLSEDHRALYDLTKRVSDVSKNNSIETFFVERAVQLLKPCGIAAIILPASILSNSDGVYTRCREIILENFDIVAIAEFSTGTFEMTGTNTITLFLRKKDTPPDFADHWRNRLNAWFESKHHGDEVFNDAAALERYCAKRGFDLEEYKLFLGRTLSPASELWNTSAFKAYRETFAKKNAKKRWTDDERAKGEMNFIRAQERDRLYYFLLADANPVPVLLVKMPTETKAAKAFLGYEWSRAKGNEGIKYLGGASSASADDDAISRNRGIKSIKTPLFDNSRLNEEDAPRLNSLIRKNFRGILTEIPEELKPFTRRVPLTDLLNFDAAAFDKQISTSAAEKVEIRSKFELKYIGEICSTIETGSRPAGGVGNLTEGVLSLGGEHIDNKNGFLNLSNPKYVSQDFFNSSTRGQLQTGDLLICKDGALSGKVALVRTELANHTAMVNEHVFILRCQNAITQRYMFDFLHSNEGNSLLVSKVSGAAQGGLNSTNLKNIKIPFPPLSVQQAAAEECAAVDADYAKAKKTIEDCRSRMDTIFADLVSSSVHKRLGDLCAPPMYGASVSAKDGDPSTDYRYIRITDIDDFGNLNNDWKTAEKIDEKYILQDGDVLFARSGATAGKTFLYKTENGKAIYAGYLIKFTPQKEVLLPRFLIAFTHSAPYLEWAKNIRGGTAQPNINAQQYSNLQVPVPPLLEQERVVAAVEALEAEIAAAKETMSACPARKREILRKHGVLL